MTYYHTASDGTVHHIMALGNPALWWPFVAAFPTVVALALRRWEARLVLGFLLALYVPWLVVGRALFLFYMTPVVPFMALGLVLAVHSLPGRVRGTVAVAGAAAAVMGAALWTPVWIGHGVSASWWQRLMLFHSWR